MNPADFPELRATVIGAAISARTIDQCERADRLMRGPRPRVMQASA